MMPTEMNSLNQELPMEAGTPQPATERETEDNSFRALVEEVNIADSMSEDELLKIGQEAKLGYEQDKESRSDWEEAADTWIKMAQQVREERTYPWPNSSNVKYPLMTTAAMQFAARAYPSLVPSNGQIVKSKVIGKDLTGEKLALATRVSSYMSYQIMHEIPYWEEEMDKMLIQLPVIGMMFKKTYWDATKKVPVSTLISPKNLIVNYWTRNLKDSERISEEIEMSPRVLKERQLSKMFRDIDLGTVAMPDGSKATNTDSTTPYTIIEQHTYLDLDGDDYKEPYIVTFHKESGNVLRIAARFDDSGIHLNDDGEVIKIEPLQYYTKFGFVPNPDGSFYDIGFGSLLGPINESVNTLINQLIDAGSLNNLQGGFLGKGLRLRMGDHGFRPGEWKAVNATGDDLKKQIVPLPTKEPSAVLFQLMGSLITSGKELASVAEIFTGKMPGQNTPATTTMATIEQGMKVFTAVYKRIFRSLEEEFQKIYDINAIYLNPNTYAEVVDTTVGPQDFAARYDIIPGADPTAVSQTEKLMKAQGLMELLPSGMLNPVEVISRVLEAQEQPNWEKLLNPQVAQTGQPPEPPPDPKLQEMEMKGQLEQQKVAMQGQAQQHKMELESRDAATKLAMKAQEHQMDMAHKEQMNKLDGAVAIHKQRIFSVTEQAKLNQSLGAKAAEHKQKMAQQKQQPKGATKKP
jgi:chaperonin GroES